MKDKIRKIRKSRIFSLLEILIFIAVCIGAGAMIAYVQHESDPTEQAVVYFRAFVQRNYDKMYQCLDIGEGSYVSEDMYQESMKKIRESMVIDSYEIEKPKNVEGKKVVTIQCKDSQTNNVQDFNVYLTKKRKGLKLVPDYLINIDNMMTDNFSVILPEGDYLELNGKKVDEKSVEVKTDKNNKTVTYEFGKIFGGQYKISSINKYFAIVKNMKVEKSDTNVNLTKEEHTANDKYTKLLKDNGENVVEQFYKAVRERKPSDKKLIACFDKDKKLVQKVEDLVTESQEIVYWPEKKNIEQYNVTDMKMSDLNAEIKADPKRNTYKVTYNYSYNYVSATETALYTSYIYKLSGKCTSTMKLTYTLKGDDIVLTNISISNKNKKDGE